MPGGYDVGISSRDLWQLWLAALALAQSPAKLDHLGGSLGKDEPQPIFSSDPGDPWNRVFHELFTRSVRTRLSGDFPQGAPFQTVASGGDPRRQVSERSFGRIESGDRAIEPLYPSFLYSTTGPFEALDEPRHARLASALADALQDERPRSPLARALMQSDAWAAYDVLAIDYSFFGDEAQLRRQRRDELLQLFARLVHKLALTPEEIGALPDNYAAAVGAHTLPDLFAPQGEWLEVLWQPEREHDRAMDYRRAARVFVKPASPPADKSRFVDGLPNADDIGPQLDSVALVVQDLLIDSNGKAVPSRLAFDVQIRTLVKDAQGKLVRTEASQHELSRRLLLANPGSSGLVARDDKAPSYLPAAANDYGFASRQFDHDGNADPILVPLRERCLACHGENLFRVFTFMSDLPDRSPVVRLLKPAEDERGHYVALRKMEREDFKALQRR